MEKKRKTDRYLLIKKRVLLVLGILAALFYGVCVLYAHAGVSWLWIWPLAALFFFARAFMIHMNIRVPGWIAVAYRVILVLFLALFVFIEAKIVTAMRTVPEKDLDYIITLGAAVRDGVPTSPLKLRIDRTVEYMQANPGTVLIASGGQGGAESMSEARCIADLVISAGIDESRVILEERSSDTEENIRNSFALIPEGASVGLVTSSFHIYRALRTAQLQGYEAVGVPAVTYYPLGWHYIVREFFGVVQLEAENLMR